MTCEEVLTWLEQNGTQRTIDGMARFGIETRLRVFGVTMAQMQSLAKRLGRNHDLALELWASGCYEARMLAALLGEPARLTRRQMNTWAADFDNWAICDTACFHLFDRTPLAWEKVHQWADSPREFVKRAAFALMASLAGHDKQTEDDQFLALLPRIEAGARDDRNFVKKGVSWALRRIGRRSRVLHTASLELAGRLAQANEPARRWVGKDALRELGSDKVRALMAKK